MGYKQNLKEVEELIQKEDIVEREEVGIVEKEQVGIVEEQVDTLL